MGIPNILHEKLTININFAQYWRVQTHFAAACIDFRDMLVFAEYIPRNDDDKRRRQIPKSLVLQFPHHQRQANERALDVEEKRKIKNIREYL